MKKIVILIATILLVNLFSFSIVHAEQNQNQVSAGNSVQNSGDESNLQNRIQENIQEREEIKEQLKENMKERVELKKETQNLIRLKIRNVSAHTTLDITEEFDENNNTLLVFKSSNGKNRIIKIMPDTASERALERLRLKVCSEENNCTIELKEVPVKKALKLVYELQVQKHYRLFGLFEAKAQNKVQVDAENGEIIQEKKPWWAFLASESEE